MKNPVVIGNYADPEARVYNDTLYLYVTRSLPYNEQKNLDVVVSKNLDDFQIVNNILDMETFKGATFAIWAPSVIEKNSKYYIIFAANDIKNNEEIGGLYIGVSDSPQGKFKNIFEDGRPFLNVFVNGAQPIDAHFFKDGANIYLYYGGWHHLNFAKMNKTMMGVELIEGVTNAEGFLEITPPEYCEAPCVLKIDERYCLMYSCGSWRNGTYHVKQCIADRPYGPFENAQIVLESSEVANGPGHNGVFEFDGKLYIAYHRHPWEDAHDGHNRVLCIDEIAIENGKIQPVKKAFLRSYPALTAV